MDKSTMIELVQKAQAGDSAALDALFGEHYNLVYSNALGIVMNPDTACDITQETFEEAIRTLGKLNEPAAFVSWLKQITYHQCTRHFRKKKEILVDEDDEGVSLFDTLVDDRIDSLPPEVLEREDLCRLVQELIKDLPEEQRMAIQMFYLDEMTVGQIADLLGVPVSTVKSRLGYARKKLKTIVEDYEKKNDIKLHSFSFLPLFLLAFGQAESMPTEKVVQLRSAIMEAFQTFTGAGAGTASAAGSAGASAAAAGAAESGAAGAGAAATGLLAKLAQLPLAGKLIAGVLPLILVVGIVAGTLPKAPEPEDTSTPSTSQSIQPGAYASPTLTVYEPSYEYREVFAEYLGRTSAHVRTTDGRILSSGHSSGGPLYDFLYGDLEGMQAVFYYGHDFFLDADNTVHLYHDGILFPCPDVIGQICGNNTFLTSSIDDPDNQILHIALHSFEENGPLHRYDYEYSLADPTQLLPCPENPLCGIWDVDTGYTSTCIAEVLLVPHGDGFTEGFVADGKIYKPDKDTPLYKDPAHLPVKFTGFNADDVIADLRTSPDFIVKGSDDSTICVYPCEGQAESWSLPEGKKADQITYAIAGNTAIVVVFEDGTVYTARPSAATEDTRILNCSDELTALNQAGKIKCFGFFPGIKIYVVLDDNVTYTIRAKR